MTKDLTVIFLTVNKVPEKWAAYHKEVLLEAIGDAQLITVSRVPMDMPGRNIIQSGNISPDNVYRQMFRAIDLVDTTYIAVAEDDSLYPRDHFDSFRPDNNHFAYNMSRWSLYEWREPMYSWRDRISNLTLIAPTALAYQCLAERFGKYPEPLPDHLVGELGKPRVQNRLGLPEYNVVMWNSDIPVLNINHQFSMDDKEIRKVKKPGSLRAFDIPKWGHARDILAKFR